MRKNLFTTVAAIAFTAVTLPAQTVSFGVFGDAPYTSATLPDAVERYERLIAHMNASSLAFGVHIGDIKAGNTVCSDAVYSQNLALFNTFQAPILYTPGDNEWTDCHRTNNGNLPPLDRLGLIRSTFFNSNLTLGALPQGVYRQPGFPENARFISDKILVVTVNVPGSNNNRQQIISETAPVTVDNPTGLRLNPYYDNDAEYASRNSANLAWLEEVLTFATGHPSINLVVIAFQGNPFERFLEPTSTSNNNVYIRSGYEDFVSLVRTKTLQLQAAGKQVLAVHGDTHTARTGKRLTATYPGCDPAVTTNCVAVPFSGSPIANFTRIETFGQNNVHWIKVTVDKQTGNFTSEAMVVPGNGTPPAYAVQ